MINSLIIARTRTLRLYSKVWATGSVAERNVNFLECKAAFKNEVLKVLLKELVIDIKRGWEQSTIYVSPSMISKSQQSIQRSS